MKTGFSLWELAHREFPVSPTGFGFAVNKTEKFFSLIVVQKGLQYYKMAYMASRRQDNKITRQWWQKNMSCAASLCATKKTEKPYIIFSFSCLISIPFNVQSSKAYLSNQLELCTRICARFLMSFQQLRLLRRTSH